MRRNPHEKIILFPERPNVAKYRLLNLIHDIPQKDVDLLDNMGVHIELLDDLAAGRPFGAAVIVLDERRDKL